MNTIPRALGGAAFVIVASAVVFATVVPTRRDHLTTLAAMAGAEWVDRPAPNFSLRNLADGSTITLESLRGHVVFLNFWGTFCAPCQKEMPSMERLIRTYRSKGLVMAAVSVDDAEPPIKEFYGRVLPEGSEMVVLHDPPGYECKDGRCLCSSSKLACVESPIAGPSCEKVCEDSRTSHRYGTYKLPETYIIDAAGRIHSRFISSRDWEDPKITDYLDQLLATQSAPSGS